MGCIRCWTATKGRRGLVWWRRGGPERAVEPMRFPRSVALILAVALVVFLASGWWLLFRILPTLGY